LAVEHVPAAAAVATTTPAGSNLSAVLLQRAGQLIQALDNGEALHKAIKLANLTLGQFNEIYADNALAHRIDKACTAFKKFAGSAVLQETVNRFLDGDTEEVVLQKSGKTVSRKVKLDSGIVKVLLGGLDPQFAQTPPGGHTVGGTHIHITNNLTAATMENINMGNEDVVLKMLQNSDDKVKRAKVVDVVEVPTRQEKKEGSNNAGSTK
jgi:hypothetical protein